MDRIVLITSQQEKVLVLCLTGWKQKVFAEGTTTTSKMEAELQTQIPGLDRVISDYSVVCDIGKSKDGVRMFED